MTTSLPRPRALVLTLGLAAAISAIPPAAQAPTWRTLTPSRSPTARTDPALALDQSTGRIVLFGGVLISMRAASWELTEELLVRRKCQSTMYLLAATRRAPRSPTVDSSAS